MTCHTSHLIPNNTDIVASLTYHLPKDNSFIAITCWTTSDLPAHLKGTAEWVVNRPHGTGYYIPQHLTTSNSLRPIEFPNNCWHRLATLQQTIGTQRNFGITVKNIFNLGWWNITDPAHPKYWTPSQMSGSQPYILPQIQSNTPSQTPSHTSFWVSTSNLLSEESSNESTHTANWADSPNRPVAPAPCYVWTSLHYADMLDCLVYFSFPSLHRSPCMIQSDLVLMYNTIWMHSGVRYQSQSHAYYDT